jgi:monoamine oxidase
MKWFACLLAAPVLMFQAGADVVLCENGDRYTGRVILVTESEVRLVNEIQGRMVVPRDKVQQITFERIASPAATAPGLEAPAAVDPSAPALPLDPSAVQQVQREILGTANPEANQMFQEMIQGLASGKMNVGDIRLQAQDVLNQVREMQRELGDDDTAGLLNSYVSILENFVRASTNAPAPRQPSSISAQPKPGIEE